MDNSNQPIAGIIGSSNMTRPAYGQGYDLFNIESDILLFDNSIDSTITEIADNITDKRGTREEILIVDYSSEKNDGKT